jgi:DNA invertase Pin-like site-specific DNA recombinase
MENNVFTAPAAGAMTGTITMPAGSSPALVVPVSYCLYARKSTEQEEKQVLSIDSQIKEMLAAAERDGLNVVEIRKESHSAKDSGQRPVFNQLLTDIREKKFNGILTWAPDRLSRNAGDLGSLVDLMDQKLLHEIRTNGQRFSNNPNEKFLLMILCSQAKLENDNKSLNVKRGLKTKAEMGLWTGPAPTGYLNEKRTDRKGYIMVDPKRAPVIKKMFEKVANEHYTGRKLYSWLKDEICFRTKNEKPLTLSNIYRILKNTAYYGVFEYPVGSGNWYTGKHTPIISQELYLKVQDQITTEGNSYAMKEFAFTKLITCGLCGSGITADEKLKKLKDGTTSRYIYYGCTRSRNIHCKGGYMREEDLIAQLLKIMDTIDINELGIKHQLEQEIARYNKFQHGVLGQKSDAKTTTADVDIRSYAKYILREGSITEKRELLGSMKSSLTLKNKEILLQ